MNSKRLLFLLIALCIVLNIFDTISTGVLLSYRVREVNPIMNFVMEIIPVENPYIKVVEAKIIIIAILMFIFASYFFLFRSDEKLSNHIALLNRSFLILDGVFLLVMMCCNFPALLLL